MPAILLRHREKVLAHAEQQLLSQGKLNTAELIALYKKFLKIEEHRVRLKHYAGGGGRGWEEGSWEYSIVRRNVEWRW